MLGITDAWINEWRLLCWTSKQQELLVLQNHSKPVCDINSGSRKLDYDGGNEDDVEVRKENQNEMVEPTNRHTTTSSSDANKKVSPTLTICLHSTGSLPCFTFSVHLFNLPWWNATLLTLTNSLLLHRHPLLSLVTTEYKAVSSANHSICQPSRLLDRIDQIDRWTAR